MARQPRIYRSRWLLAPAILGSIAIQAIALLAYSWANTTAADVGVVIGGTLGLGSIVGAVIATMPDKGERNYRKRWMLAPATAGAASILAAFYTIYQATRETPDMRVVIGGGLGFAAMVIALLATMPDRSVGRERRYRNRWMLAPAFATAIMAQVLVFAVYDVSQAAPPPHLTVRLVGEGEGTIQVSKVGDPAPLLRCSNIESSLAELGYVDDKADQATVEVVSYVVDVVRKSKTRPKCEIDLPAGTRVRVTAVLGKDATFGGYRQLPMRTPEELVPYLGDPLAKCVTSSAGDVVEAAQNGNGLDCSFTIKATTELAAEFGEVPDHVDMAMLPQKVDGPEVKPLTPPKPLTPIDAEKLDEKPLEVAIAPLPKQLPPPILPPPPPPPQAKPPPPKPVQPPPNMVMVEVKDDKNVKKEPPPDATKLSDKNRDVEKETKAKDTNLEKEQEGKTVATKESEDKTSKDVGGPDKDQIRQTEDVKTDNKERVAKESNTGTDDKLKEVKGENGKNGQEGTGERKPENMMGMRGLEGRGKITEQGNGKKTGKKGTPGINTPLAFNDYEKIIGKEKVDEERQVAARKMSAKKGRWERKLDAVRSSLENFVPDVQTGNQTALKTRAHPFALYIARMHRRIHELWGFGYLEQLDEKPASYPLNNLDLWVNLEVSVNADGSVHKVTIAKTSGKTEFDVAAVDTVLSAAPYEPTPEAIRSVNGKIYLRWGFYRNWRQCGTFNVEPYILTSVPSDDNTTTDSDLVKNTAKLPGKKNRPMGDKPVTPDDGKSKDKVSPSSSVTDQQAVFAAGVWVSAFTHGDVDKLVKHSTVPFYAAGKVAAQTAADLKEMFSGLVVESGAMKDYKLLSPNEYSGGGGLPEGNVVLQIRTEKESFAIVLTRTKSGEYRATQLAR